MTTMDMGEDPGGPGHGSGDEHLLLPCKIRRNYACKMCSYASNNPRHFLYHQRDDHGQRGAIHECPFCVYASCHTHKLLRHIRLVHSSLQDSAAARQALGVAPDVDLPPHQAHHPPPPPPPPRPPPVVLTIPRRPPLPYAPVRPPPSPYVSGSTLAARLTGGSVLPKDLEVILVGGGDNRGHLLQHHQQQLHHHHHQATPPLSLIRLQPKPIAPPVRQTARPDVVLFPVAPPTGPPVPRMQSTVYYSVMKNGGPQPPPPTDRRRPGPSSTHPSHHQVAIAPTLPAPQRRRLSSSAGQHQHQQQQQQTASRTPDTEYSCSVCPFRSRSRVLVQRHEKGSHLKKKFFRCQRCPYVTNVRARYTKHVRYHSMPYIKCEKCDFSTPYKWNLDRHRRNHLEDGSEELGASLELAGADLFRCDRCSFVCHSKQSLSVHLLHHHSEGGERGRRPRRMDRGDDDGGPPRLVLRLPRPPAQQEPPPVDYGHLQQDGDEEEYGGPEESGDERQLEEAEELANQQQQQSVSYACAECGEAFNDVDQLDRHAYEKHVYDRAGSGSGRRITAGRPEISCGLCPYKAKWISEVVRHRRVHAKEKPYRCPNCDFRSRWKGDMTRHLLKHHGQLSSPGGSSSSSSRQPTTPGGAASSAEVSGIDQLLDQSMQVGGENELSLFGDGGDSPEQDSPLDLSRPVPEPHRASVGLELLPMLLRMPPRQVVPRPPDPPADAVPLETGAEVAAEVSETPIQSPAPVPDPRPASVPPAPVPAKAKVVAPSTIRKSYQCPHCPFRSSTASRFHMHMVVHANSKPYGCSACTYRSNWQWDITKHAKIKSARDPAHATAVTVLVNDTGSRNYEKYDRYVVYETVKPASASSVRRGKGLSAAAAAVVAKAVPAFQVAAQRVVASRPARKRRRVSYRCKYCEFRHDQRRVIIKHMEVHTGNKNFWCGICGQSSNGHAVILRHCRVRHGATGPIMQRDADPDHPLPTYNPAADTGFISEEEEDEEMPVPVPPTTTTDVEVAAAPDVASPAAAAVDEAAAAAAPTSSGEVAVEEKEPAVTETDSKEAPASGSEEDRQIHRCLICPYQCRKMFDLRMHSYMHKPHEGAIFKCAFCPFFVSLKSSWIQHMRLHVEQPSELVGRIVNDTAATTTTTTTTTTTSSSNPESSQPDTSKTESTDINGVAAATTTTAVPTATSKRQKRYKCGKCPYTTDSHSTILYHRQFHRHNPTAPFRCDHCSYAVSRSHLLNQHLRVHGVVAPPLMAAVPEPMRLAPTPPPPPPLQEEPEQPETSKTVSTAVARVWVHRDGIFAKMFRCRHCPHVSKKRGVIVEHEKMHDRSQRPLDGKSTYECSLCNYSCRNAGILTTHMKVHGHAVGVQPYTQATDGPPPSATPTTSDGNQSDTPAPPDHHQTNGTDPSVDPASDPINADSFRDISVARGWTREEEESSARRCFLKVGSAKPNTVYRPCGRCPAKFYKPDQLVTHRSHHGAGQAYGCRSCDFSSADRKAWRRHVRVHSADYQRLFREVAPQTVALGGGGGDSPSKEGHIAASSPLVQQDALVEVRRFHCHLCPASFIKNSSLSFHASLHGVDNKYKCTKCSYSVTSVGNLVRHVKVHTGGRPVELPTPIVPAPVEYLHCPKCPAFFTRAKIMHFRTHVSLHGSRLNFACRRCDYATNSATSLNRHRHVHENAAAVDLQMPPPPAPPPAVTGSSPGRRRNAQTSVAVVERQQKMLEKLRAVTAAASVVPAPPGQKVYSCERCPYVHLRRGAVVSHMRRHRVVGAGPENTCPYCDYSCTVPTFLRDHVSLHVGPPMEPRHGLPSCSVAWDTMEIWARHADQRTLVYRYPNSNEEAKAPSKSKISVRRTRLSVKLRDWRAENAKEEVEVVAAVAAAEPAPVSVDPTPAAQLPSCSRRPDAAPTTVPHDVDPVVVAGLCDDLVASVSAVLSDSDHEADDGAGDPRTEVGEVMHCLIDSAVQLASLAAVTDNTVKSTSNGVTADSPRPVRRSSRELNGLRAPLHLPAPRPAITKEELLGQLSLIPMTPALKRSVAIEHPPEVVVHGEVGRPKGCATATKINETSANVVSASQDSVQAVTQNGHGDCSEFGGLTVSGAPQIAST